MHVHSGTGTDPSTVEALAWAVALWSVFVIVDAVLFALRRRRNGVPQ